MSQEHLEAFRRGVEAYNRRDADGVIAEVHPDVEWHDVFQTMLGGDARSFRGYDGLRELIRDQAEVFEGFDTEYSRVHDLGDRLVAVGTIRTRGTESGVEIESPLGAIVDFKDGKAIHVQTYLNHDEALRAAGLSE